MAAKKGTFEEDMARLEEIVARLEQGDTPLEEALDLFEQGSKLALQCGKRLDEAEQRVSRLTRDADGNVKEVPLEGQE